MRKAVLLLVGSLLVAGAGAMTAVLAMQIDWAFGRWALIVVGGFLLLDGALTLVVNVLEIRASRAVRLALELQRSGRDDEAIPVAGRAVARRRLLILVPGRRRRVAGPLRILVELLVRRGRDAEALPFASEEIRHRRSITRSDLAARVEIAEALARLEGVLRRLGHFDKALSVQDDLVAVHRELAAAESRQRFQLAWALGNLVVACHSAGRHDRALSAAEEFVALWRALAVEAGPIGLGWALDSLADAMEGHGQDPSAVAEESLELWRSVVTDDPSQGRELASALTRSARMLARRGSVADALAAVREAAAVVRAIIAADPGQRIRLVGLLGHLGQALNELGEPAETEAFDSEAVTLLQESIDVVRVMAAEDLSYREFLPPVLNTLAATLERLGRTAEARAAAEDAVTLTRTLRVGSP